ncbi:MAG: zinc ABC transporter substrate-binding protein [Candidatus Moraniibacteriota bacterium]|nr:MAG: zinc ABC transporter substrate-binding protein [Candidatus Moranbacteria bacterium]
MKKLVYFFVLAIFVCGGAYAVFWNLGKESSSTLHQPGKLQVVASFYPLYFFSQQIGGDKASVTNIVPAGAEPHDYEPTAQDMARMEKSGLIILNGSGLESWGDSIGKNINTAKTIIVVTGEGLTTREMTREDQLTTDPHVWLDPVFAGKMVENITRGFEAADQENAIYFRENANQLLEKLKDVDIAYRSGLQKCAEKNIITSHDAFGYLAAEYGFNQVSIAGLSPDAEPSPSQLADTVQFAKVNNVRYIFFESLASPKLSQTIATEVGAQTLVLNPIEGLSDDEISKGKDYFSVMYDNLKNLQTALQCTQ